MEPREKIEEQIFTLAAPKLEGLDLDLVDAEYKREPSGLVLRLFIDKEGGVSLDDCQEASRTLEPLLEAAGVDDLIPGPYNLEVSSPGLFRPLKRLRDFQRALGQRVKIRVRNPLDGQRVLVGQVERVGEGHLFLRVDDAAFEIELENISKANLEPELRF